MLKGILYLFEKKMSIDWNVVCDKCGLWQHLGQDMGGYRSFGYGSNDPIGQNRAADFIQKHICHNWAAGEYLKIVKTDNLPNGYIEDRYL